MKALEEMKEEFLAIYRENVKRDGADALLKWLLESDFFEAPASTRFHGSHEGGLVMHSLNVYHSLCDLVEHAGLQDVYSAESIAISALLHDVCKVNFYKKGPETLKMKRLASGTRKMCTKLMRNSHAENMRTSQLSSYRTLSIWSQKRFWRFGRTWADGIPQSRVAMVLSVRFLNAASSQSFCILQI